MVSPQGSALQLFVNRLSARSTLTEEETGALLGLKVNLKTIANHVDFVEQGEHVDHACLIADGLAARFGANSEGARQLTCLYIPGDMADLPSVVSPKSGWGLTTLTATTVLRLPHSELRQIAAKHPGIAEAFWRDCVAEGSIFSEWVVNVGRRDAMTRISHLLCEMAIRYEQSGLGSRLSFPLPATQVDLADATGLTSVHINRTLQEMRRRSLMTMVGGKVTIPDWAALARAGDFDEAFLCLGGPAPRIAEAA